MRGNERYDPHGIHRQLFKSMGFATFEEMDGVQGCQLVIGAKQVHIVGLSLDLRNL
jgi:hypothetical protein